MKKTAKMTTKMDKKPSKSILKATKGKVPTKFVTMGKGKMQNGKC